jgi:hypothetical protein
LYRCPLHNERGPTDRSCCVARPAPLCRRRCSRHC